MRGIRIIFDEAGPRFDVASRVQDLEALAQNALVNVGTDVDSDPIYEDRGTHLRQDGMAGRLATLLWTNHSAAFAALRTTRFLQQTANENDDVRLRSVSLTCVTFQPPMLDLNLQVVAEDGRTIGQAAQL